MISSSADSNESTVAHTCHLAAMPAMACARCVILVALRNSMNNPVGSVMEHSCEYNVTKSVKNGTVTDD